MKTSVLSIILCVLGVSIAACTNPEVDVGNRNVDDSCNKDSDCGDGQQCLDEVCCDAEDECSDDNDCVGDDECIDGQCVDPGNEPECNDDNDCDDGVCEDDECVECREDSDCSGDDVCQSNRCQDPPTSGECDSDDDCTGDDICVNDDCVNPECSDDNDCSGDDVCEDGRCVNDDDGGSCNAGCVDDDDLEDGPGNEPNHGVNDILITLFASGGQGDRIPAMMSTYCFEEGLNDPEDCIGEWTTDGDVDAPFGRKNTDRVYVLIENVNENDDGAVRVNTIEFLESADLRDGRLELENEDFGGESDNWMVVNNNASGSQVVFTSGYCIEWQGERECFNSPDGDNNEALLLFDMPSEDGGSAGFTLDHLRDVLDI